MSTTFFEIFSITFIVLLYYSNNTIFRKLELFTNYHHHKSKTFVPLRKNTEIPWFLPLWGQIKLKKGQRFQRQAIADSPTHQLKNLPLPLKTPNHQKIPTPQQKLNFPTSKPLIVPFIVKIPKPRYFHLLQIPKIKIPPIQNFTSKSQIFLLNKENFDVTFYTTNFVLVLLI